MSTRTKTVENWPGETGRVELIIQFGDDLRYHVPYFARNTRVSPIPTTLESKFQLTTQVFTIPRLNGGWAGLSSIKKPRLNVAAIWGWISSQIQSPRK